MESKGLAARGDATITNILLIIGYSRKTEVDAIGHMAKVSIRIFAGSAVPHPMPAL